MRASLNGANQYTPNLLRDETVCWLNVVQFSCANSRTNSEGVGDVGIKLVEIQMVVLNMVSM